MDLSISLILLSYSVVFFVYPRLSLMSLPLFFPLYLWKFELFGLPLNLIEALVWLSFLLWLFKLVFLRQKEFWNREFWRSWVLVAGLFLLAGIVSVLIVDKDVIQLHDGDFNRFRVALGIFKSWILSPVLYFVMFASLLRDNWYKHLSLRAYIISSLVLSLWALWQVWTGDFVTIDGRASGPFVSANYLSLYIGPALTASILLFWDNLREKKYEAFLVYLFLASVLFAALIFSRSYGAFLAIILALFCYVFLRFKSWKKFFSVMFVILLFSFSFAYFQRDTEKFEKFFEFDRRSSSSVRLQTWQISASLIKENSLFGLGLGQFPAYYELEGERILSVSPYEKTQLHPHNLFLSFWLNMGILGFLTFLLIIYKTLKSGIFEKKSLLLFATLFLVMLFHGFVDQPFFKNDLSLLFWFLIGLNYES